MWLLIDGYNLLFASDLVGTGRGPGWLQQARQRLLDRLAQWLPAKVAARTVVVFDSSQTNADADSIHTSHGAVEVVFASDYDDADTLIEQIIARHPQPKRLTVISGDNRLETAARRRRAVCFAAEPWYEQLSEGELRLASPVLRILQDRDGAADSESAAAVDSRRWVSSLGLLRRSDRERPAATPRPPQTASLDRPAPPRDTEALGRARAELPEDFERLFGIPPATEGDDEPPC